MQKRLLITVSGDIISPHGVRFVGSFFRNKSAISATLFCVAPRAQVSGIRSERLEHGRETVDAGEKKAKSALDYARQILCHKGFPSKNVTTKLLHKEFGTIKDIIREAREGAYNAVALGRRGYMLFESVLSTSITRKILEEKVDFPLWVCRHPEENRKNVLLCIDGSASSIRMIAHAGFMLKDENEHLITLFHVDKGEGDDKEAIFGEAKRRLTDNWISNGRLETVFVASSVTGVAKTILNTAQERAFAAVGAGRVGIHKGHLKEWLTGSRTIKLLEGLEKAALWVSS